MSSVERKEICTSTLLALAHMIKFSRMQAQLNIRHYFRPGVFLPTGPCTCLQSRLLMLAITAAHASVCKQRWLGSLPLGTGPLGAPFWPGTPDPSSEHPWLAPPPWLHLLHPVWPPSAHTPTHTHAAVIMINNSNQSAIQLMMS